MSGLVKTISVASVLAVGVLGFSGQAFATPTQGAVGSLIINEYNAVAPDKTLEDGEHDPAFGSSPVVGNGENWVELVVVGDNTDGNGLDIREWTITWESLDNNPDDTGTLTFTDDDLWSALKPGTIITIRRATGYSSNVSYDPCGGSPDWVINVSATDSTYITMAGVNFKTDNDGWMGKITDNVSGTPIQNWVGELENPDTVIWNGSGVNSREVGKLEANPSAAAANDATSVYRDGNCSSFGAPNCWNDGASVQSFTALRTGVCP